MKKIIAFGASSSKNSINKKFATFAAHQISDADIQILDLNDFEMPIYSIDREQESGIPALAHQFKAALQAADAIIISFAEHNGAYSTAFKNILDWISRIKSSNGIWENKPMFLLATSPGGRGGKSVLNLATTSFKFMNKNKITSFSLPSFHQNFTEEAGIKDETLGNLFHQQLQNFLEVSWIEN